MSRITINSNIAASNAQLGLTRATKALDDTSTRLSSGLRINKAADDAAGLAISESLKADAKVFVQGVRNLNDGVSLLSIADGALGELSNIDVRLRELAEQSSNGTLADKQRNALDAEAQALSKEFNRIARTTEFNGIKLFDGGAGNISFAAGGGVQTLVTSSVGGAIGTGTFRPYVSYGALDDPTGILTADFNRDGIEDIVYTSTGTATLSVFLGNGDGTFRHASTGTTLGSVGYAQAGDLDNDGNLDFVVTAGAVHLEIHMGNGDGTFRAMTTFGAGALTGMAIADLTGDGVLDIVGRRGFGPLVMIGNGNGSFSFGGNYTSIVALSIAAGDLNGDGSPDLLAGLNGTLSVLLNNGNGTFRAHTSYASFSTATSVLIEDFNEDGIMDIAGSTGTTPGAAIFLGNGDGTFRARNSFFVGTAANAQSLTFSDMNGDGHGDLLVASIGDGTVGVALGNGNGTFLAPTSFATATNAQSGGNTYLNVGDYNQDGVMDVATIDITGDAFGILFGNSNPGVSALRQFSLRTRSSSMQAMSFFAAAHTRLSQQRGHIGAFQSRVEVAMGNLQQSSTAYREASSRMTDTDMAEESAKLVASTIRRQAAAGVLAQANLQPQITLQLIGNL